MNSGQIAAGIKEKVSNQGEVLCGKTSRIYLPFLIKQMETMPQSHQQSATQSPNSTGNVLVEVRNSMANCDI